MGGELCPKHVSKSKSPRCMSSRWCYCGNMVLLVHRDETVIPGDHRVLPEHNRSVVATSARSHRNQHFAIQTKEIWHEMVD